MKISKPQYRFVVAFDSEAKSIISFYKLKICDSSINAFKCYKNEKKNIWLVISGKGNINAAAASVLLKMISPDSNRNIWINIGIAGDAFSPVGSIHNIKKIINSKNEKETYYTNSIINSLASNSTALNVEDEERTFKNERFVYEMESLGFIKTVEKFCARELICIFKIISDNRNNLPDNYMVLAHNIISKNMITIDSILEKYHNLSKYLKDPDFGLLELIQKKYHLSFSNKEKMKTIVTKISVILDKEDIIKEINNSNNLKCLFIKFEKVLSENIIRI